MHYKDTGKCGLPGGLVEPHEQRAETAVREMWEETGLLVELTGIIGVDGGHEMHVDYPNGDQVSYVSTFFSCRAIGGHLHARDGEALNLEYFAEELVAELDLAPWVRTWLPHLYQTETTPFYTPNTWSPDHDSD